MKKMIRLGIMVCCMILFMCGMIEAAELASVMNVYTDSDSVVLFIKDPGREIDQIYFGNDEAQQFTVEESGAVRTVVVLDNSLSINKKYRDTIREFLTNLVAARKDGDTFTIATFAKDINYLVQDSNDYLDIKTQIDGFQFIDQESYFTNVLYTVMNDISRYDEVKYTRIIVIADGVDNEALGYTDDEFNRKLQAAKIPIYSIGCTSKGNEENLKKMFALSRMSNAKSYLFDDASGNDILRDILNDANVKKITIIPQEKSCTGAVQPVRVCFGEDYCVTEVTMPFKAAETVEETTTAEATETAEEKREPLQEEPLPKQPEKNNTIVVLLGSLVLLGGIIALAVIKIKKTSKHPEAESRIDISQIGRVSDTVADRTRSNTGTEILGASPKGKGTQPTDIIINKASVRLVLQDEENPSRTFEYPLRDKVIIGKDPQRCQIVVDYDKYVSGVHCEIVSRGDKIYVRDGGCDVIASTNGTFVDGKKAAPELPLKSGAVLKIGGIRFKVTYK